MQLQQYNMSISICENRLPLMDCRNCEFRKNPSCTNPVDSSECVRKVYNQYRSVRE